MELTPGVLIIAAVVVIAATLILGRLWRRSEGGLSTPSPAPTPVTPPKNDLPQTRLDREGQALVKWLLDRAGQETGVPLAKDPLAVQRIAEAALSAVDQLREKDSASINLPFLTADASGPKHFNIEITRSKLKEVGR